MCIIGTKANFLIFFFLLCLAFIECSCLCLQCFACIQMSVSMHNLYIFFILKLFLIDVWYKDSDNV